MTNVSVRLTKRIRLKQAIKNAGIDDPVTITQLTINGFITDDDMWFIGYNMAETLQIVDMGKATVDNCGYIDFPFQDCTGLTKVIVPNVLDESFYKPFQNCPNLTELATYPDNPNYTCEDGVLFNREKTKLLIYPRGKKGDYVIPDSVTEIDHDAINLCVGLTTLTIPNSVTEINNCIFWGCDRLYSVVVHPDNPIFLSENGVLFNKDKTELLYCPDGMKSEYVFPDSVIKIKYNAFLNCTGLTSVVLPASEIELLTCKKYIFDKKEEIAFEGCTGLRSITAPPNCSNYSSEDGVLFNKDKTRLIFYPRGRQGDYAIPDTVVEIGWYAFYRCTDLTSITIPDSVVEIGRCAFGLCTGLTSVTIPDSVVKFKDSAFCACSGLTSITIPSSVTEFESGALGHCYNLSSVEVHPDNPIFSSENGVLFNKDKTELLYCPDGLEGDYVIPDSVVKIGGLLCSYYIGFSSVNSPDSVFKSEKGAFENCKRLTSVTVPASVIEIAESNYFNEGFFITVHPDNPIYRSKNGKVKQKRK